MNVELLQQIKQRILAEPERFDMGMWRCGTTHCIGGWAAELNGYAFVPDSYDPNEAWKVERDGNVEYCEAAAVRLLGIDEWEADRLFFSDQWPGGMDTAYSDAITHAERARIAAERIDHFIATEGAE